MKRTIYRTTKLLSSLAGMLMLTAVMMIGCNQNVTTPQPAKDSTPPAEVTNLQTAALAGAIRLTWTDPADADLWGIEITSPLPIVTRSVAPIPENAILVPKGQESLKISNLEVGKAYTFTVKTIDESGNKSTGITTTAAIPLAGEPMTFTLTQNPTALTNGNVTISFTSSTSIKIAKWKKGVHSAKDVFASGTAITGNSFEVSENAKYSVGVQDNEGRREVEIIEISNIDKTPPAPVSSLTVSYSSSSKKITVNWQNPPDSDFAGLTLSWKKGTGSETPVELTKDKTSYEISDIAPDDSTYTITVSAKDEVGNTGSTAETTVKATATAEITKVELNGRTHFDTVQTDRNITVTVSGSNFDKLTSLLVQVTDGSTNYPPVPATIDASHNTATATVQAPVPSYPTDEGTRYTVKAIANSTAPAAATASFIVSNPAKVRNIELKPAQLKVGSATKVSVAVTGTNFDIRGETKIKLLDSNGDEAVGSTVTVAENVGNETEFTAEIANLPAVSGVYTVAVFFKGNKQTETAQLQLYGAPEITSVSIPKAGTGYGGNKLPVTIKGKNFTAPGASFSGSGASITNFTVVNETTATAMVDCPYSAGEHPVTVMCGTASNTGTISVKDYTGYDVGKIVLADKTLVDKGGYTINSSNPPVGIICGSNSYKAPQMIALHTSGSGLEWAKDGSTGYNKKFEGIICRPSQTGSGAAQTATFTGDTDGSDNWAYICSIDPDGTANAAVNYPAFNWVNTYNTTYADKLGSARPSWYMPSLAELCEVYKNRESINESLAKIREQNSSYADSSLGTSWYWSSSQVSGYNDSAWYVNFSVGTVGNLYKNNNSRRVCCLAGF